MKRRKLNTLNESKVLILLVEMKLNHLEQKIGLQIKILIELL